MHLVSRVNQSDMIEIRKYLVSSVTKVLVFIAALMCGVTGIVGFIENRNAGKLIAILALSGLTIGLMYGIEYLIALAKYRRMQILYETEILNFHVYFEDDYMRVVSLGNREVERIGFHEVGYHEISKCYQINDRIVLIIGWQVFIFDNIGSNHTALFSRLLSNDIEMVFVKTSWFVRFYRKLSMKRPNNGHKGA